MCKLTERLDESNNRSSKCGAHCNQGVHDNHHSTLHCPITLVQMHRRNRSTNSRRDYQATYGRRTCKSPQSRCTPCPVFSVFGCTHVPIDKTEMSFGCNPGRCDSTLVNAQRLLQCSTERRMVMSTEIQLGLAWRFRGTSCATIECCSSGHSLPFGQERKHAQVSKCIEEDARVISEDSTVDISLVYWKEDGGRSGRHERVMKLHVKVWLHLKHNHESNQQCKESHGAAQHE